MIYGVILAAGSGKRMKTKVKKQYLLIKNKPIFLYSIEKFINSKAFDHIILVLNDDDKESKIIRSFIDKYKKLIFDGYLVLITGGKERYDSVKSAIDFIDDFYGIDKKDKILIHDSARPNFDMKYISLILEKLNRYDAVTLGTKITDTIKEISDKNTIKTLDRDKLYRILTPQGFRLDVLYSAYKKFYKNKSKVTDDMQIVEKYADKKHYILDSDKNNIKITTLDDINVLKYMMSK